MRFLILSAVAALVGCSTASETAKTVAQCQLDADSPAGLAFRKSKMGADFDRYTKSYDYNLFMIKCMEAKGYSFPREGDANYEGCWSKKVDSAGVQNPNVDAPPCYTKS